MTGTDAVPATSYALLLARSAARVDRAVTQVAREAGLRLEEWRILDHLAGHSGTAMSDLADAVLLTGPTLTRTVDHLVSRGLVHRAPASRDRRKVLVHLAPRGQAVHSKLADAVAAAEHHLIGDLGTVDAENLRRLLERFSS